MRTHCPIVFLVFRRNVMPRKFLAGPFSQSELLPFVPKVSQVIQQSFCLALARSECKHVRKMAVPSCRRCNVRLSETGKCGRIHFQRVIHLLHLFNLHLSYSCMYCKHSSAVKKFSTSTTGGNWCSKRKRNFHGLIIFHLFNSIIVKYIRIQWNALHH